jgi:tol-pal system protein YbgF
MNPFGLTVRWGRLLAILPGVVFLLALAGCGSAQDAMDEEFGGMPAMAPAAQLELRVDSLMNENRKLRDQIEAITSENRRLTAKSAELETKVSELTASAQTPPPAPAVARGSTRVPTDATGYEAALAQFNSKNYSAAIDQFQTLLNNGTAGSRADNCNYWLGESYYGMRKYGEALQSFKSVLEYKRSSKIPYAYMMIGNCEALLGNRDAAREAYTKVASDFPTSPVAAKAQAKLAKLK